MGCPGERSILELVDGIGDAAHRREIREHVDGCMTCQRVVAELAADVQAGLTASTTIADSPCASPPDDPRIGRFVVIEEIGSGAMGRVLKAYDPELARIVAIKLMRATHESAVQRMVREARAMARVNHPNVVPIYDVGRHGMGIFIAMEYVEGWTLRHWCASVSPPWARIIHVFCQAAEGLSAAHREGLVHRDFKPDNVIVGSDNRVRVMDFGLAREEETIQIGVTDDLTSREVSSRLDNQENLTHTGTVLGTPAYMAPEQHLGDDVTAKSDQFALCVALFECLYGVRPFVSKTLAALLEEKRRGVIRSPPSGGQGVPSSVHRAILRGLRVDPEGRWPSLDALVAELSAGPRRTSRRLIVSGGFAIAVLSCVAYLGLDRGKPCTSARARISEVWSADRMRAVDKAMIATEAVYARETSKRVRVRLDDYAANWTEMYTEACVDTRVRRTQSEALMDVRIRCLEQRRGELAALVETLVDADIDVVEHAVDAVAALPALERCATAETARMGSMVPDDPALQVEVEALRTDLMRVTALKVAGRFEHAQSLLHEVAPRIQATSYPPLMAEAALREGELLEAVGAYGEALGRLQAAFFLARQHRLDDIAGHAAVSSVQVLGLRLSRHDQASAWAKTAEAVLVTLDDHELDAALCAARAALEVSRGRYEDAIRLAEQAIGELELARGPEHPGLVPLLEVLGNAHRAYSSLDEAQRVLERAVQLSEGAFGAEHPRTASALASLANLHRITGDHLQAQKLLERALAIREAVLGPEHPRTLRSLLDLGLLYRVRGEPDAARRVLERCLANHESTEGGDPVLINALGLLAMVELDAGNFEASYQLSSRALVLIEGVHGPDHVTAAEMLKFIGLAQMQLGRHDEARASLERALPIIEKAQGADHFDGSVVINNLAFLAHEREDFTEARGLFERALEIREQRLGREDPQLLVTLRGLGTVAVAEKDFETAIATFERALMILEGASPHADRLEVTFRLAQALWDAPPGAGRDRTRAIALVENALEEGSVERSSLVAEIETWRQAKTSAARRP